MATSGVWKAVKAHVPLIRFRKEVARVSPGAYMSEESQSSSSAGKVGTSTPPGSSVRGSGLEDEGIPQRYRRKPITSQEMEYIERGGPE